MHLGVIRVPHPDRGEPLWHEADREDVLEVVGRASLESCWAPDRGPGSEHEGALRVRVVLEDVVHDPGVTLVEDAPALGFAEVLHDFARRVDDLEDEGGLDADAQIRDDLVCARHVDEPHLAGTDTEGEPDLRSVPVAVDAELVDRVDDRVNPDGARDLKRREVQRFAERLAHGERPVLLLRRVHGRIGLAGPIRHRELDVEKLRRGRHARLQHPGEIGEELECGAWLSVRDARVVVVALHLRGVFVIVVAADVREDLPRRRIERDQRGVVHVAALESVDVVADFLLRELLHVPVERAVDVVAAAVRCLLAEDLNELLAQPEREVRRVERRRRRLHHDRLVLRRGSLGFRRVPVVHHRLEDQRPARLRAHHVLDRVEFRRSLREAREKRHLAQGQLTQVGHAEVRRGRGLQAIGLVPVVDLVEIHLEDLLLAERARRLEREDRLLDLAREGRVVPEEARLDELLGDRRPALGDAAARAICLERAHDSADIDAGVRPEGFVLDRDRRVLHPLRDSVDRDQIAPLVGERVEEMLARAVVDMRGERDRDGREIVRRRQVGGEIAERRDDTEANEGRAGQQNGTQDAGERANRTHRADAARHAPAGTVREAIGAVCPTGHDPLMSHSAD